MVRFYTALLPETRTCGQCFPQRPLLGRCPHRPRVGVPIVLPRPRVGVPIVLPRILGLPRIGWVSPQAHSNRVGVPSSESARWRLDADERQPLGTSRTGKRLIEGCHRRRGSHGDVEVGGVVGGETMLAGERAERAPVGVVADPDREPGNIEEECVCVDGVDSTTPFVHEQNVANLERPEGRDYRLFVEQPLHGGVRNAGLFVGEAPGRGDRCVEHEGHRGLRPWSRASISSSRVVDGRRARAAFMRWMIARRSSMVSSTPTMRATGTPRRVMVKCSPRSTWRSNSGRRVLAS